MKLLSKTMKKVQATLCLFFMMSFWFMSVTAQTKALWVGETFTCNAESAASGLGSIYNRNWSSNGGYLSLSSHGLYCYVTATHYWSGTASVTFSWDYSLYYGDNLHHMSKTWYFTCQENPVSISPTTMTLNVGETGHLSYSHKYSNSYTSYADVYFSGGSSCVSVTSNGTVTALSPGTAYVHVYSNLSDASNSPYCTITVQKLDPTSISLPNSITMIVGDTKTLTPTISPTGASTTLTWESSNSDVVGVNKGVLSAKTKGTARISVTTHNGKSAYCDVTVKDPPPPPSSIKITPKLTIYNSFTKDIDFVLEPKDAQSAITWSSSDSSIASVSSGKVTGKSSGKVNITATTVNGLTATCEVTIEELPANLTPTKVQNGINNITNLLNRTANKVPTK